jgi:hypothetical protein
MIADLEVWFGKRAGSYLLDNSNPEHLRACLVEAIDRENGAQNPCMSNTYGTRNRARK